MTSRCDVALCGREELHHFLHVPLRGMLPLFSIMIYDSVKLRATEYKKPAMRVVRVIRGEHALVRVGHVVRRVKCAFSRFTRIARHVELVENLWIRVGHGELRSSITHHTSVTRRKFPLRHARRRIKRGKLLQSANPCFFS